MQVSESQGRRRRTRERNPGAFGCPGSSITGDGSGPIALDGGLNFEKMIPHRPHSTAASCSNPHFGQADDAGRLIGADGTGIPVNV